MTTEPEIYSRRNMFADDHAATMVNRYAIDHSIGPHGHDFFEIALAARGSGGHVSASGERMLTTGDVIVIRPGAWHGYYISSDLVIHNCCFNHQLLQRELSWLREDAALNYLLWTGPYAADRRGVLPLRLHLDHLPNCLKRLDALAAVESSPRRAETLGHLLLFLDCLSQGIEELEPLKQKEGLLHPAVLETVHLLESQIERGWTLGELASRSHVDPSYLVRLFTAQVGLAPIAYLNRCRVERAAGLLLHTDTPVAEVAAQVGWFDPNLFARRFRAAYGMSPSDYRKRFGGMVSSRT